MNARIDRSSRIPLWRQIRDDIGTRISRHEFADAFPPESRLQEEYGVSRQTIRQALRQLREDGVVTAQRGRTPRLATPTEIEQPLGALYSLFDSVRATGISQHSIVRELAVTTDATVADRLGLDRTEPLLHLARLRLAGDEPLALDEVWLPAGIAHPLLDVDWHNTGFYEELGRRCGVRLTSGEEHLRAVIPTASDRAALQLPRDTAVFAIDRLGISHDRPLEWRHTLVRGDRFSMTARFDARSGYLLGIDSARGD
ncbi:GntR family transcriptional regulator [Flexivirga caeni]|nr:GntR family transcriptional regulator [Flexivirga caeni]